MTSRWPGLVRLAFGLTGDRWLAEDLAQTALASAYASWWRVCRADDPDAYVRRILINASKSRLRRRRVREQPAATAPEAAVSDPTTSVDERSGTTASRAVAAGCSLIRRRRSRLLLALIRIRRT